MLEDLMLAPREEDEMEDFHYGEDGDDMESKLDTYDETMDDDDDDEEEVVVVRNDVVAIPLVSESSAGQMGGEGADAGRARGTSGVPFLVASGDDQQVLGDRAGRVGAAEVAGGGGHLAPKLGVAGEVGDLGGDPLGGRVLLLQRNGRAPIGERFRVVVLVIVGGERERDENARPADGARETAAAGLGRGPRRPLKGHADHRGRGHADAGSHRVKYCRS